MRLVVTGANGLIGKHFIKHYSDEYQIVALTRSEALFDGSQHNVVWNSTDYSLSSLTEIFTGADAVLHLASIRPSSEGDCLLGNLTLDNTVFRAAKQSGISNITYISSRSVYGDSPTPWHESDELNPKTDYALSKTLSEVAAQYYNLNAGLRIKILRLAQVFSHDEYKGSLLNTLFSNALKNRDLEVNVKGISRDYLYISDVISALSVTVKNRSICGVFNLGSGCSVSLEFIAETIASVFKKDELLVIKKNRKLISENSLMNSKKFYTSFGWTPEFDIQEAIKDIYTNVYSESK